MHTKFVLLISFLLQFPMSSTGQKFEAAFSHMDDAFYNWNIHISETDIVHSYKREGLNPYSKWELSLLVDDTKLNGYFEQKRKDDIAYWDFNWNNEWLSVEQIYANDIRQWRIRHGDKIMTIQTKDQGQSWENRNQKSYTWKMYMVKEDDFRDWYIDDNSTDQITTGMRLAAIQIIIEMVVFSQ